MPVSPLENLFGTLEAAITAVASGTITATGTGWTILVQDVTKTNGIVVASVIADKSSAFTPGSSGGEVMFTMPVGFRPTVAAGIGAEEGDGGTPSPSSVLYDTTGDVRVIGQTGNNTQVRMTLVFRAA